jgi:hypothetical protein
MPSGWQLATGNWSSPFRRLLGGGVAVERSSFAWEPTPRRYYAYKSILGVRWKWAVDDGAVALVCDISGPG